MNNDLLFTQLLDDPTFRQWVYRPTPADEQHWTLWFEQHPDARPTVDLARHYLLGVRGNLPALPDPELSDRIDQLLAQTEEAETPVIPLHSPTRWRWWVAAASVVLVLLGYAGYQFSQNIPTEVVYERVRVANNGPQTRLITLGDGSTVLLQPHSQLDYERPFRPDVRQVWLSGEAFFEVTKNPRQPFRIQADKHFATQVLGTSFRIRAFPNEPAGLVAVKTGRVAVFQNRSFGKTPNAVLTARQQAVVRADGPTVEPTPNQPTLAIEQQSFAFEAVPLREVARTLETAYGVRISLSPALAECRLTALLGDEPLPQKLRMITTALGATYQMQDTQIQISGPGCNPSEPNQ